MGSLIQLVYQEDLNRKDLLTRRIVNRLPSNQEILKVLDLVVDEISPRTEDGIILKYYFSNRHRKSSPLGFLGYTILIFPKFEPVEYYIKKGDFWINQGKGPIEVKGLPKLDFETRRCFLNYLLLFRKNPFENKNEYDSNLVKRIL